MQKIFRKKSVSMVALGIVLFVFKATLASATTSPFPNLTLATIPLISVQYGAPQILFVLDNSQSMDGNLSGAIMTGSGTISTNTQVCKKSTQTTPPSWGSNCSCSQGSRWNCTQYTCETCSNQNVNINSSSSSPIDFTIPSGFTPPVTGATTSTTAPYTSTDSNGYYVDNSPSRLNIAKAAIEQAYQQWNGVMDFGLMDYGVHGTPSLYTTWVYYMSGPNGFLFHNSPPSSGSGYSSVKNPCYYSNTQSTQSCQDIQQFIGSGHGVFSKNLMWVAASSDNPDINDVLYDSGASSNMVFSGPYAYFNNQYFNIPGSGSTPKTPYNIFGRSTYNSGGILIYYSKASNNNPFPTGPTNAGYVPYSPQVWYSERGFGYYNSITNTGNLVVPIKTSDAEESEFSSRLAPETSNPNSLNIKADAVNATMAGTLQSAYNYLTGNSPGTNGNTYPSLPASSCNSQKYVILVTDGLPTVGINGTLWPPLGSAAATGYGVTATFNSNGSLAATNDNALSDTITAITDLANQGIKTYVVGLGAGVDPSKNPEAAATLTAMAVAGGTQVYIPATTPAALSQALTSILQAIEAQQSTTGVSLNSSSQTGASLVYQASYVTKIWTGNLKAETLSSVLSGATSPTISWQASGSLPTGTLNASSLQNGSTPNVFTWNPQASSSSPSSGTGYGEPFIWSSLSPAQQSDLEIGYSTLGSQQSTFGSPQAYGKAVMQWLLNGNTSSGVFRTPASLLADIVNSTPLYVGAPDSGSLAPSYQQFATQYATRTPMVYVGSNGGMLYGFNATNGAPIFSYVPSGGIYARLSQLPQISYAHQYYVDGSPSEADIQTSSDTWESLLVGGLDSGGNSIYALNVTDPTSFNASDVLWDFTNANLGLTYSQPQIAEVDDNGTPTWAVIFGSGYNSATGYPYLFIVNAATGSLIKAVNLYADLTSTEQSNDFNTNYPEGLSTPAIATNGSGFIAGTVYVGDLQGNLWRINLQQLLNTSSSGTASATSSSPAVSILYHATTTQTNSSGTVTVPAPITTQPVVTPSPSGAPSGNMVFFGTGQLLTTNDLTNSNVQTVYGILDTGAGTTITTSQLQKRGIMGATTTTTPSQNIIVASSSTATNINWATQDGWYMPLTGSGLPTGLRSISNIDLNMNRLIFTIYAPNTSTCGGSGQSYLMILNYLQGSTFSQPQFYAGSNFTNPLTSNGKNAMGVSLGNQYAGTPTQTGNHLLVPLGNGTIQNFTLPTPPIAPVGWRSLIR